MRANGAAIRAIRRRTGLSLGDIKRETGLHRGYLSELERGIKGARPDTLDRIALALDVPVEAIHDGSAS